MRYEMGEREDIYNQLVHFASLFDVDTGEGEGCQSLSSTGGEDGARS